MILSGRHNFRTSDCTKKISVKDKSVEIARSLCISTALAEILVRRGIKDVKEAQKFLSPRLEDLLSPFLFSDMERAVKRILRAIREQEKILICGDYDADGITATVLLHKLLRLAGCPVECYIPDRLTEGYGLHTYRVKQAKEEGISLIVTVDCGISSVEEIALANSLGIDVIVTDHHEPMLKESGELSLPEALAILNPRVSTCAYPFLELSGAGVAFKLCCAIIEALSSSGRLPVEFNEYMLDALALTSLGAIADVVPLTGENRILVKFGLRALESSKNCGLQILLDSVNLNGRSVGTEDVAFRIAPRLNAAGRMGRAELALNLLLSNSTEESFLLMRELDRENRRRQKIEAEVLEAARKKIFDAKIDKDAVLFVWDEGWHPGVTGIVAARLAEEFRKPVVLIALDGDKGKGTARSISNLNIYELLKPCIAHFSTFGGHSLAAGFEVAREKIEEVKKRVLCMAEECIAQFFTPSLEVDLYLPLYILSVNMVREFERLKPFGEANPPPTLFTEGARIVGRAKRLGKDGQHLSFFVRDSSSQTVLRAMCYRLGKLCDTIEKMDSLCSIAYRPYVNNFQGEESVELEVQDIYLGGKSLLENS